MTGRELKALPWRIPLVLRVAFVGAAYYLIALSGIAPISGTGRTAAMWLASGFLLALTLPLAPQRAATYFATGYVANLAAMLVAGLPPMLASGISLCNLIEVLVGYTLLRREGRRQPDIADPATLGWLALFGGIVAPAVAATCAAGLLAAWGNADFITTWTDWLIARSLGMLLAMPVFTMLFRIARQGLQVSRQTLMEWVVVLGAGSLGLAYIFWQSHFPFLFMASLFVVLAAFRLGAGGAVASTVMVAIFATTAAYLGHGPIALVQGDLNERITVLQVFLLFTLAGSLPVASAMAAQKKLRENLRASRDYIASILDNMQEVVFRTDAEGRWTFLNPAWESLTGYTVAEGLGTYTKDLLVESDKAEASAKYAPLVSGETEVLHLQQQFVRADGAVRHVEATIQALRGEDGSFLGTSGNLRDVTAAREAQSALQQSERRFQTLTALSPAGIFSTDAAGQVTYVNDAWLSFAGLTHEQALGEGWAIAVHPDDLEDAATEWQQAVAEERSLFLEFRFRHPDGKIVSVLAATSPETDFAGNVIGHIGVVIDISDVDAAREELAAERARFKYLAENATDAIIAVDLGGICRYASPAIFELCGYLPEEVIDLPITIPIDQDDEEKIQDAYSRMFTGESDREVVTYRVLHKTRGWRWNESSIQLVRDPETGAPQETVASVRDVTHRVALEKELTRAKEAAEEAAGAKSAFLANMSHEIRTPMNGVVGFADRLLETNPHPQQRPFAKPTGESGRSLVTLINDILDISKIEAGQFEVMSEPVNPTDIVSTTAQLMHAAAEQKGLRLETELGDGVDVPMLGDGLRIKQILSNIVGNAIKFTVSGSVRIRAEVIGSSGDEKLRIAVTDTGKGIAPERLEAIFREFEQEDASIVRQFGGTGLGLTISRSLAQMMGGRLSVESVLGEGSTFTLELPHVAASAGLLAPEVVLLDRRETGPGKMDTRRILVAEDHEVNRLLISAMLERVGYVHEIACDGDEAIAMIEQADKAGKPFSLVLMDVQMPRLDGLEATARLREAGYSAEKLPIVALTANAFESDIAACLAAGMQAHVAKPVQLDALNAELDHWLPRRRAADPMQLLEEKLSKARDKFALFKAETLVALREVRGNLSQRSPRTLESLKGKMHKMAGSAGMLGEGVLGDLASDCEMALEDFIDGGAQAPLEAALDAVIAAIEDAPAADDRLAG